MTGDSQRERARKIRPEYADGPLVRVARAAHQAESEMMESLLLEAGIPALSKRSGGFDVPDFLAAGPRDVLVPASGAEAARELLGTEPADASAPSAGGPAPWVRVLAVVLAVLAVAALVAALIAAVA